MFTNFPLLTTVHVMFRRAKRRVVMVRLHTLSSWLPKHKGFARRYARESCFGFRVTSEVTSSIQGAFYRSQKGLFWSTHWQKYKKKKWQQTQKQQMIYSLRYWGDKPCLQLNVVIRSLNIISCLTGNQQIDNSTIAYLLKSSMYRTSEAPGTGSLQSGWSSSGQPLGHSRVQRRSLVGRTGVRHRSYSREPVTS